MTEPTQRGVLSIDAWFASLIDAFHLCMVGSPPTSLLCRIKSYAFLGSCSELRSEELALSGFSAARTVKSRNDSTRSRPFAGVKSLKGRS